MKILLNYVKDIKEFVHICSANVGNIYAEQGRHIVNAKSILGLFSLDLSEPIEVKTEDDVDNLYSTIERWKVGD